MATILNFPRRGNAHGRTFDDIQLEGVIRLLNDFCKQTGALVTWFEVRAKGLNSVTITVVTSATSKDIRLSWHSTREFMAALRGSLDGQLGIESPAVTVGLARDATFAMLPGALGDLELPSDFLQR